MKKILSLFVALVAVLSLAACGKKETTAKGYGLVHKDYVGIAEITVNKKGVVTALTFEEVYFPTHWAGLTATEGVDADLFLTYTTSKGKEANVAKYVVVDGKLFTGSVDGTDVKYAANGIADLKAACKDNEETAKWYAEALLAGKAFAAKADGSKEITGLTDAQKADFIKGYYEEGMQFGDGKMYMIPWSKSTEILYYNKDVFAKEKLEVPTHWFSTGEADTTSMEYVCKVLKEKGAKRVIELNTAGPFHTKMLEKASLKLREELENVEVPATVKLLLRLLAPAT